MLRSLLVPLDGSPTAEDALPMARALARRTGACIRLVLVREPPRDPLTVVVDLDAMRERDALVRQAAAAYLGEVAARLRGAGVAEVEVEVLDGEVVGALREAIERTGVDCVAMCTHGRGGWNRFWVGSIAQELVRRVQVPLLLTRPHGDDAGHAPPPPADGPERVVVTLDGSAFAEHALEAATRIFGPEAAFTLLRVITPPVVHEFRVPKAHPDYEEEQTLRRRAEAYLHDVAERLAAAGIRAETVVLSRQHAPTGIAEFADAGKMHAVAIASHARVGMPRLVLGSVADKVLRATQVPVLVVRPPRALDDAGADEERPARGGAA